MTTSFSKKYKKGDLFTVKTGDKRYRGKVGIITDDQPDTEGFSNYYEAFIDGRKVMFPDSWINKLNEK